MQLLQLAEIGTGLLLVIAEELDVLVIELLTLRLLVLEFDEELLELLEEVDELELLELDEVEVLVLEDVDVDET